MKLINTLGLAATAIIVSACVSSSHNGISSHPQTGTHGTSVNSGMPVHTTASTMPDQVFSCRNGMTATVKHNAGENQIRLHISTIESSAILHRLASGSGEHYAGHKAFYNKPAEFHLNDDSASLRLQDPYGNQVSTTCRRK